MTKHLLAAEADQIQDFIFRASHLREVVGGSQLLTRFCEGVPGLLLNGEQADVVVRNGGSFRVEFDDDSTARKFGEDLAEVYRRATDGTLSVAEPVEIINDDFAAASAAAEEKLREAKRWRRATETTPQLPYIALCASCGIGLAVTHGKRHEDENPNYLCQSCQAKACERDATGRDLFIRPFVEKVVEGNPEAFNCPFRPEDVSRYDPRRYVAYLVADGNNLGQVFGLCGKEQMRELSLKLTETLRESLATPTRRIMKWTTDRPFVVPVLPLVLGGDDVFALLPASWALDFTLEFCRTFEMLMRAVIAELELTSEVPPPTISATIVVCKETYPYRLAHRAGEERLKRAKQVSKALAYEKNQHLSVVDFEIILGSQVVTELPSGDARSTLRPYWVLPDDQQDMPAATQGWGLPIHRLIQHRWWLRRLAGKRLAQLRELFDHLSTSGYEKEAWITELERLLNRISRDEQAGQFMKDALGQLGSAEIERLYRVKRRIDEKNWRGHGLPDLLEAWDFAFDMDKERDEYGEA
jgi:hypothetical protein